MSIKGRVVTSLTKICDSCSAPYCTKIDEQFDITVLSSSRKDQSGLPEIGDSDPSVIYVKPGTEIDIDSSIQETIRLTASAKVCTCSMSCRTVDCRHTTSYSFTDYHHSEFMFGGV
uniref:Uncharacterized protein n=1 Tax=Triticum urartu TaxID=4572 RepID=A0A8R7U968_TRIUA